MKADFFNSIISLLLILLIIPGIMPGIVSAADGLFGDGGDPSNSTTHADLTIERLYTEPAVPEPGSVASIYAVVSNTGDAASDQTSVTFTVDDVNNQIDSGSIDLGPIDPGSDETVSMQWKTPVEAGPVTITAAIDGVENSQKKITLSVESKPPILAIDKLYAEPAVPGPDSDVSIFAVISNKGGTASSQTSVNFTIDGVNYPVDLGPIDPKSDSTVSFQWKTPVEAGPVTITASIFGVENSQKELHLSVKEPLPDLIVDGIVPEIANPQDGQPINFTANIKNQGSVPAGEFLVTSYLNETPVQSIDIQSLEAGKSTSVPFSLTPDQVKGGSIELKVVADSGNTVLESNEDNNVSTKTVNVKGLPSDLTIESIYLNPMTPKVKDNITFTATIKNVGLGAAPTSMLKYSINGTGDVNNSSELSNGTLTVPAIDAGGTSQITFFWTPTSEGNIEITALADASSDIPENDETNNLFSINATVTKESSSGGGGGSSSGGGSGSNSGSSSSSGGSVTKEPVKNIASKELSSRNVVNGVHVRFDFSQNSTCVTYIEYDPTRTFMKTTTIVEELKGKSTFVPTRASGRIYKYFNVWVGDLGGLPTSIANGTVGFKVEKSWINNNSINQSLITLQWYNKSWEPLNTEKVGEDDNYSYFAAKTPGYSFFAITDNSGETGKNETQMGAALPDTLLGSLEDAVKTANVSGNSSKTQEAKGAAKMLMAVALPVFLILVGYLVFKKKI